MVSNLRDDSRGQGRRNVIRLRSRLAGVGKARIIDRVKVCAVLMDRD